MHFSLSIVMSGGFILILFYIGTKPIIFCSRWFSKIRGSMAEQIIQYCQYLLLIQLLILFTVNFNQRTFVATAETMCAVKINQVPDVIIGQVLFNYFYETFISPRKAGTSKTNLNVNFLFHSCFIQCVRNIISRASIICFNDQAFSKVASFFSKNKNSIF